MCVIDNLKLINLPIFAISEIRCYHLHIMCPWNRHGKMPTLNFVAFCPQVAPSLGGQTILDIHEVTYLTPIIFRQTPKSSVSYSHYMAAPKS